jgi:hypothetical protein
MKISDAIIVANKKKPEATWRDWTEHSERAQELYAKAKSTQTFAEIKVGDGKRPVCILPVSDLHLGARGVDYKIFRKMTEEIVETPDLYVALVGDLVEFAIKLRSVAEVMAQTCGPDKQVQWLESWLDEIKHKTILSTWCNHAVEREEKQAGVSAIKALLAERFVMFDGIGHADISVGKEVYKFAFSHKFRGSSYLNAPHAGQRYMRFQGIDREIAVMGDIHQPAYNLYWDGPQKRISLVAGTLNVGSLYAQRYFSIFTQAVYPCIELSHKQHAFTPFENLQMWREHQGK